MSWVPLNLSSFCTSNSTLSACQSSSFMFLALIADLFGHSEDSYPNKRIVFLISKKYVKVFASLRNTKDGGSKLQAIVLLCFI
ncbi:hypothetical protein E2986_13925 [Frieseomelitta varia]|uniref:Uncharacterized protein n=1 Tax=Frieseomelitta varia TaxID=561572 RepID=A0A833SCN6_9HYME|nr:hypothetical protein E2986_13925 [Frieseomelitta varia]